MCFGDRYISSLLWGCYVRIYVGVPVMVLMGVFHVAEACVPGAVQLVFHPISMERQNLVIVMENWRSIEI